MGVEFTRRKLMVVIAVVVLVVVVGVWVFSRIGDEFPPMNADLDPSRHEIVAVFGATGDVGDGILKAVMNDPDVRKIHVITRRDTARIDEGVDAGLVTKTVHMDYLDYTPLEDVLEEVDAVYWAIGTSAANVDNKQYGVIHVDFPMAFLTQWLKVEAEGDRSFHYVSGGGASEKSRMHWAREKARAETVLFDLAKGTDIRVVSYRPGAVIPAAERGEKYDGLKQLLSFSVPIKLGIRSLAIGQAMLEVTDRVNGVPPGTILENDSILIYANGYDAKFKMLL